MKSVFHLGFATVLCLATSCSDSSEGTPAGSDPAGKIGPDGGTVTTGDASVEVPEGALTKVTLITVAESDVTVDAPEGYVLAGPAIAFTPHGLSFEEPVTLTLPYSSSAAALAVLRLDDEDDDSWEVIDGGSFSKGSATLDVSQFSIYAVAEESETPEGTGGGPALGEGGAPGEPQGTAGASDSAGAPAAGGAPAVTGGDLSFSCDRRDDVELSICTDYFYPALVVELAGITPACPGDGTILGDGCDTTEAVIGCLAKDADGIAGVNVTNWFYTGTAQDIMNGVLCSEQGIEFVDPP